MSLFKEHTTSVAFSLTLSRAMLDMLVFIYAAKSVWEKPVLCRWVQHHGSTKSALIRRGLIDYTVEQGWYLTYAGDTLAHLLIREGVADYPLVPVDTHNGSAVS